MKGEGVDPNYAEASKWFQSAADKGNARAQTALAYMYEIGQGTVQNYVLAHMWSNLAAARGEQAATRIRDDIGHKMTQQQIAEAQRLAAAWRPKEAN